MWLFYWWIGASYTGNKNRHSGYHQIQVAFSNIVDHNTIGENWFNVDSSFNRDNNGTFFYKFIKKNTNDDTEIYCTGIRILVQPFINSDNTFDALAIDEFQVFSYDQSISNITPTIIARFIDPNRIVTTEDETIITVYNVPEDATSNDVSNNIDISRNYLNLT